MHKISYLFLIFLFVTTTEAKINKYNFNMLTHNENFLLFGGYTNNNLTEKFWDSSGNRDYAKDYQRDKNEAQFQISFKIPLAENFLYTNADLFFAYTQNSFWQVYDKTHSSPFRETNYMPELFLQWYPEYKIANSYLKQIRLSVIHQSNGQDLGDSRSWNRTQLQFLFQQGNFMYGVDIWDRWNENAKTNSHQTSGDDNPSLIKYLGRQRLFLRYKIDDYQISLSHQNDIFDYDSSKGNIKLDLTIPSFNDHFDFFIRYFNGYGESLIDYDVKIKRISFGVIFSSWN